MRGKAGMGAAGGTPALQKPFNRKERIERKEKTGVIASKAKQSSDFFVAHIFWIASLCSQ